MVSLQCAGEQFFAPGMEWPSYVRRIRANFAEIVNAWKLVALLFLVLLLLP